MTTIQLYKPGKWEKQVDFPTDWDELTVSELKLIGGVLSINGLRQDILMELIAMRAKSQRVRLPWGWQIMFNFEQGSSEGLPLVGKLLDDNTRTINPFPVLRGHFGPADDFNDMTVGEFEDCEIFFLRYHGDQRREFLEDLAAALWRPIRPKGKLSERIPYSDYKANPKSFSRRLDVLTLHAIHLWYTGCRGTLPKLFPLVFGGDGGEATEEQDLSGFTRLIHSAAGPKNGTRRSVRATPLKELLFDCQLAAEQAAEMEEELKKK